MNISVFDDKFVKGRLRPEDHTPYADSLPLRDALEREWDTDAHFVQYNMGSATPRINKECLAALDVPLEFYIVAFDVDNEGHKPWSGIAEVFEAKAAFLAACDYKPFAFYSTKNGYRVIFAFDSFVHADQLEAISRGMLRYLPTKGIPVDQNCKDWTRMFRMPKVMRDGASTSKMETFHLEIFGVVVDASEFPHIKEETPKRPALQPMSPMTVKQSNKRVAAYIEAMMDGIHKDIADAAIGQRNTILRNKCAKLGDHVAGGCIDMGMAMTLVIGAVTGTGLDASETSERNIERLVLRGKNPITPEDVAAKCAEKYESMRLQAIKEKKDKKIAANTLNVELAEKKAELLSTEDEEEKKKIKSEIKVLTTQATLLKSESKAIEIPIMQKAITQCVQAHEYPEIGGKDGVTVKDTIGNMQFMLERCGINLSFNCIKREVEANIPGVRLSDEDKDNDLCAHLQSIASLNDMPARSAVVYGETIARQYQRNPVKEWIESKPWDGVSRFRGFADTLTVSDEYPPSRRDWILRLWMTAAMYGAIEAKTSHICMVLQGEQNQGKGGWISRLCPKELDVVKDGMQFNPKNNDDIILAAKYWIVELCEFDGAIRKSDAADLKAYLTKTEDNVRVSYARKHSKFKRRTAFIASVNEDQFLVDATGNRRFFTIKIKHADRDHKIDMQQMWAEVYQWYLNGDQPWATKEQVAESEKQNEHFTTLPPSVERVIAAYDWTSPKQFWPEGFRTSTQILMDIGVNEPKPADSKSVGSFLTKRKCESRMLNGCKTYRLPPPIHVEEVKMW